MSDLSQAVGHQSKDKPVAWNTRDLLTYAVGIGAKYNDLPLVYELDSKWAPFPTYPVVLAMKGDTQDINLFSDRVSGGHKQVLGLPKFDPNRIVHGSQSIEILKPLPKESGAGWKITSRIVGVHENKSGIIVDSENILLDPHGTPYARLFTSTFNVGAQTTGQRFSKSIAAPPQAKKIPQHKADWVIRDQITPEQAVIYRLSGDYNPLHIDPKIGEAAGFGGIILHGLSTFGFAARAVVSSIGGGDPNSLRFFGVRFTSPVKLGNEIETSIWEIGPGPDGTTEVAFITKNLTSGKIALGSGIAYVNKKEKSKL